MAKFRKRRGGPWYGEDRARALFELDVRKYYPTIQKVTKRLDGRDGCSYIVDIEAPFCETRRHVEIFFDKHGTGDTPITLVDGPTDSPHRFGNFDRRQLCVWYSADPRSQRWTRDDGLLQLLTMIKFHLFREEWWRETGEWPGPKAPH